MNATSPNQRRHPWLARMILWIVLPSLLLCAYFLFLAEPTYESEARMIVRENAERPAPPGLADMTGGVLGEIGQSKLEDAYILVDYLHSGEMINTLNEALDLREHFASSQSDFVRRLPASAPTEEFYRFFRNFVRVTVSQESGIVTLRTRAFDPHFARRLAVMMTEQSEKAINDLNERMLASTTELAGRELEKARDNLIEARRKLFEFQTSHRLVAPESEVELQLGNLAELDAKLLEKQTELRTKESFLQEDTYEIRSLREEVEALKSERENERSTLISPETKGLAEAAHAYQSHKLEAEFAMEAYTTALASHEKAKIDATRQEKFLLTIAPPHQPEEPVFPRPLRGTAIGFIVICLVYGIGKLIIATIHDHTL